MYNLSFPSHIKYFKRALNYQKIVYKSIKFTMVKLKYDIIYGIYKQMHVLIQSISMFGSKMVVNSSTEKELGNFYSSAHF